jgi:hypothetical protein
VRTLVLALVALLLVGCSATKAAEDSKPTCGVGHLPPCPTPTPTPPPAPTPTPAPTPPPSGCTVTLSAGATIAPAIGQVICLHSGEYPGFYSSASGWTLKSYPGEWAYIDGNLGTPRTRLVEIAGNNVTLSSLTVQDAPTQWGAGIWVTGDDVTVGPQVEARRNHSFGIKVSGGALRAHLRELNVWANDTGFEASSGDITGFELTDSWIHDHQTMVTDGTGGARGANATNFYHTTGAALIARNDIWNNRAVSVTYGFDGGAFEVYGSTGLTYDANRIWDSQNVMEQGTDAPANSVVFTNNVAYDASTAPVQGPMGGVMVRACRTCTFSGNRFYDMDAWSFLVVTSNFTGGVINDAVSFDHNAVEQDEPKAISVGDWTGITVHDNGYFLEGTGTVGYSPLHAGETVTSGPNPVRP